MKTKTTQQFIKFLVSSSSKFLYWIFGWNFGNENVFLYGEKGDSKNVKWCKKLKYTFKPVFLVIVHLKYFRILSLGFTGGRRDCASSRPWRPRGWECSPLRPFPFPLFHCSLPSFFLSFQPLLTLLSRILGWWRFWCLGQSRQC